MDLKAQENWMRWQYCKDRGHLRYMMQAARCEGMYLGGGEQWSAEDAEILAEQGRPAYEFNEVKPSVNSAIGYQINNRMDITYKPANGDADMATATALSKVAMQVCRANQFHWLETQVFGDGLIEQRGYYDLRMSFDNNIKGEMIFGVLDPRDVAPDPDAKSYDPDGWGDVTVSRYLTLDEIEQRYGKKARGLAEESNDAGADFGEEDAETRRNSFGADGLQGLADAYRTGKDGDGIARYRIIDRQRFVFELTSCIVFPETGDVQIEENLAKDSIADALAKGAVRAKRMKRRVKWLVTTYTQVLFDDFSPYEHFTVVPYFPYFRRGKTRGMVDDAIGPQEALNKAVSQFIHIINTAANSGWVVEENSLTNMDTEDLENDGARTGLVVEYKQGSKPPVKIQANQVPTGVDRLIDRADKALKDVTVPEAMRGMGGANEAGVAIQSKQFASQQQLAVPLDNLAHTRRLLAARMLKLMQRYYDSYRVFRITETDPRTGKEVEQTLEINKFDPTTGAYLYDVTVGTYDVVITEQPMQITFENSQFTQALEMRAKGVRIPDATVIRYSNLADKQEILENMQGDQPPADPTLQAKADLMTAQARKAEADIELTRSRTVNERMTTMYSSTQAAQVLMQIPGAAAMSDGLLHSSGFEDQDAGTIVPQEPALDAGQVVEPPADIPTNTDPLTPASPAQGLNAGIETQRPDGVRDPNLP